VYYFILAMELVGPEKRTMAGIFFKYFFAFGQFILVTFAFFIRDWRVLAIIVFACTFPYLSYFL
jgi:OCT family organic cation transporter-like MFS transporter 4/5